MGKLDGKVAFITGAARGQGRAHAVRLAHEGADIIASDICGPMKGLKYGASSPEELDETKALVEAEGRRAVTDVVDVRDLGALEALAKKGVAELGRLDIVLANAGVLNAGLTWEYDPEAWQLVIDVNLTGVFNTVRATVPIMVAQGEGGSIVLTSSTAGLKGQPFTAPYTAAKHGVVGLAKTLANELGEHNIRVNTIHPAGVKTEMVKEPELFELITRFQTTLGPLFMNTLPVEWMQPEDVSGLVAWLVSDEAKYVTGAQMPIDFGFTAR